MLIDMQMNSLAPLVGVQKRFEFSLPTDPPPILNVRSFVSIQQREAEAPNCRNDTRAAGGSEGGGAFTQKWVAYRKLRDRDSWVAPERPDQLAPASNEQLPLVLNRVVLGPNDKSAEHCRRASK